MKYVDGIMESLYLRGKVRSRGVYVALDLKSRERE